MTKILYIRLTIVFSLLILIISFNQVMAQDSYEIKQNDAVAEKQIRDVIYELKQNCYEGRFSMTYYREMNGSSSTEIGKLIIDGLRYKLELGENSTMFDGKTNWAYSKDMNEVTIIEPTEEELATINPIAMIEEYLENYTVQFGEEKKTYNFFPKDIKNDQVYKMTLMLNQYNVPFQLTAYNRNGDRTTFIWEGTKRVKAEDKVFRFEQSDYPDVEVNDLR